MKIPIQDRFWEYVKKTDSCWFWTGSKDKMGYGMVTIYPKTYRAHRIVWELTNGAIPNGKFCLHKCDVFCCVNPEHLFLGTIAENNKDRAKKGRSAKIVPSRQGEKNPVSKLKEDEVIQIRNLYKTGEYFQYELGEMFSVHPATISSMLNGKSWNYV